MFAIIKNPIMLLNLTVRYMVVRSQKKKEFNLHFFSYSSHCKCFFFSFLFSKIKTIKYTQLQIQKTLLLYMLL